MILSNLVWLIIALFHPFNVGLTDNGHVWGISRLIVHRCRCVHLYMYMSVESAKNLHVCEIFRKYIHVCGMCRKCCRCCSFIGRRVAQLVEHGRECTCMWNVQEVYMSAECSGRWNVQGMYMSVECAGNVHICGECAGNRAYMSVECVDLGDVQEMHMYVEWSGNAHVCGMIRKCTCPGNESLRSPPSVPWPCLQKLTWP